MARSKSIGWNSFLEGISYKHCNKQKQNWSKM